LHLKPADEEDHLPDFANPSVVRGIVKRYSDFITYPVKLAGETVNSMKPIWSRPANEVSDTEYDDFYRHLTHDWQPAALHIPLRAEGTFEYQALLYVPKQAPLDLFFREGNRGLTLYVKRVLILEECEELLPSYLRFVRGVVDAADLPLNVSREILQQNRQLAQIRKRLARKVIDTIATLADTVPDTFSALWEQFGVLLKEGYGTDGDNRSKLETLLRFQTSNGKEKLTSLADYVSRMSAEQEFIYYIAGDSRIVLENSPHLEELREKNYEVLFLTDPVDELVTQHLLEFGGKKLRSAAKTEPRASQPEVSGTYAGFFDRLQRALAEWVKEVRLSERLRSSPACLVGEDGDLSPHLERLLQQAQRLNTKQKRILELNPKHPVVEKLKTRFDLVPDAPNLEDDAYLLFGQALLAEGSPLPDPARFSRLVAELMAR
jgi:molecular chaperone HtpG